MTKIEHTPEPWVIQNGTDIFTNLGAPNSEGVCADKNDGWQVGDASVGLTNVDGILTTLTYTEQKANARRIVAAVNACEGISTELLEQGIVQKGMLQFEMLVMGQEQVRKRLQELQLENNENSLDGSTGARIDAENRIRELCEENAALRRELNAAMSKASHPNNPISASSSAESPNALK